MNKLTITSDLVSYASIQCSVITDARFSTPCDLALRLAVWHRYGNGSLQLTVWFCMPRVRYDNRAYRYILQHFWESGRSKSETRAGPLAVVTTTKFITVC